MRVRVGLAAGTRPPGKPRGLPWAPARRREGGCQAWCGGGAAQRPRGREPRRAEQPGGGGGQAPAKPWTDRRTDGRHRTQAFLLYPPRTKEGLQDFKGARHGHVRIVKGSWSLENEKGTSVSAGRRHGGLDWADGHGRRESRTEKRQVSASAGERGGGDGQSPPG